MFMGPAPRWVLGRRHGLRVSVPRRFDHPPAEPVEIEVDDRRGVEREELRKEKSTDNGDAKRTAQFRTVPCWRASGSAPSRAEKVVIMMGRKRRQMPDGWIAAAEGCSRSASRAEIDHHDRILLHDADEQNDATSEINNVCAADDQRQQRAYPADGSDEGV